MTLFFCPIGVLIREVPLYTKHTTKCIYTYSTSLSHTHRVLVVLYNLGVPGEVFDQCFRSGFDAASSDLVVRFRSKRAFRLSLKVSLIEMFSKNIGPASSIGNPDRDPTLRPIVLGSWPRELPGGGGGGGCQRVCGCGCGCVGAGAGVCGCCLCQCAFVCQCTLERAREGENGKV